MQKRIFVAIAIILLLSGCVSREEVNGIKLRSPAFKDNQMIPSKYTCQGDNVSPPLEISEVPEGIKSFALIIDDPDAPMGTWVHWVVWAIPADRLKIVEGEAPGKEGKNDFGSVGYGGPCPPSGTHRYSFKLYALDFIPQLSEGATKAELMKDIEGHVLTKVELVGAYKKQ